MFPPVHCFVPCPVAPPPVSFFFFFLMIRRPPRSTPFPSPTLFRSSVPRLNTTPDPVIVPPEIVPPPFSTTVPSVRSAEHTSELQSHLNLVCRLLLQKKKINHILPALRLPPTCSAPPLASAMPPTYT